MSCNLKLPFQTPRLIRRRSGWNWATGAEIPIEERSREEVAKVGGATLVADGIPCRHPAFDVTPARWVEKVYTERGAFSRRRGEGPAALRR